MRAVRAGARRGGGGGRRAGVEQWDPTPELLSALMPARRPTLHTIPIPSIPPFRPNPSSVLRYHFDDTPYSTTQTFFVHVTRIRSKPPAAPHPRRRDSMSRFTRAPPPAHRVVDSGSRRRAGVNCSSSWATRRRLPLLAPPRSPVRRRCQVDPRRLRGGFAVASRRPRGDPSSPEALYPQSSVTILWIPLRNNVEVIHTPSSAAF